MGKLKISVFRGFLSFDFEDILDTLPLLRFQFCFFRFFTDNQPQIYCSVKDLFSKKFIFWYAVINMQRGWGGASFLGGEGRGAHWALEPREEILKSKILESWKLS